MLRQTFNCALLLALVAYTTPSLGAFTNIQTLQYDDTPAECIARIDLSPFVKIGKNYYLVDANHTLNWFDAHHECRTYGADLLDIENVAEMTDISNYLMEHKLDDNLFWTSGNDLGKDGKYKWSSTGQAMTFTKWATNQPDNYNGSENCVHLIKENKKGIFMNDLACVAKRNYICKLQKPKTVSFTVW